MPEISRFLGIIIFMVYNDHEPPHFHAKYGEYQIKVEINSGVIEGKFPRRALNAVLEWNEIYKTQLVTNWELSRNHEPLNNISPLE